ncbi:MAG: hypothetical protein EOM14_13210, partial [Clostridia bacterium]|nr:hypothetical protein [Clostridia bacterium]
TEWYRLQPSAAEWDFRTPDRILELYGRYHIRNTFTLAATPEWAAPDGHIWSGLPGYDAWRRFVATMAERYKGRNHSWEIWNEPDLTGFARFGAEEYAELLKIAYGEIRKADPETPVMIGGFSTLYAHCSQILVEAGASVECGDKIALAGHSGRVTGPHLHFELIYNGKYLNPEFYL